MSHNQIRRNRSPKYPSLKMAYKPFPAWIKIIWWGSVITIFITAVYYSIEAIVSIVRFFGG